MAGLAAALGLIVMPLLGPLVVYLVAQPFTILTVRRGVRAGILAGAVAATTVGLAYGPLVGLSVGLPAVAIGVGLGHGIRRGVSALRTVMTAGLGVAVVVIVLTGATAAALRMDPFEALARPLAPVIALQVSALERAVAGYDATTPAEHAVSSRGYLRRALAPRPGFVARWVRDQLTVTLATYRAIAADLAGFLRLVLPMILAVLVVAPTFIAYSIAGAILRRLGHVTPSFPPMLRWQISRRAAVGLVLVAVALLAVTWLADRTAPAAPRVVEDPGTAPRPGMVARQAWVLAFNFVAVLQLLFVAQGFLVVLGLLKQRGVSVLLRGIAGYLVLGVVQLIPFAGVGLMYVGFLDSWYDFRKLAQEGQPA